MSCVVSSAPGRRQQFWLQAVVAMPRLVVSSMAAAAMLAAGAAFVAAPARAPVVPNKCGLQILRELSDFERSCPEFSSRAEADPIGNAGICIRTCWMGLGSGRHQRLPESCQRVGTARTSAVAFGCEAWRLVHMWAWQQPGVQDLPQQLEQRKRAPGPHSSGGNSRQGVTSFDC